MIPIQLWGVREDSKMTLSSRKDRVAADWDCREEAKSLTLDMRYFLEKLTKR